MPLDTTMRRIVASALALVVTGASVAAGAQVGPGVRAPMAVPTQVAPASHAVPSPDPAQRMREVLAFYRENYPAYYEKHYAHLERGTPRIPDEEDVAEPETVGGMVAGEDAMSGARTLRGHTFPIPRLVPGGAFAASSFYVGTSAEFYRQPDVDGRDPAGEAMLYDRNLAFIRLRYGVDYAVHDRFAIGLDADYLAMVGANESSILLYGGQTGYDFRPHMRGVVFRDTDSGSQLAISAHATFEGGIRAVPQGVLNEINDQVGDFDQDDAANCIETMSADCAELDTGDVASSLAITRSRRGGGGGATFAQALGSMLGMQLGATFEVARKAINSAAVSAAATDMRISAGLSPTLDLGEHFPVGAALAYRFEWNQSRYEANAPLGLPDDEAVLALYHRTSAGLYYTGRRDLMLGWTGGFAVLQDGERSIATPSAGRPGTSVLFPQPDAMLFSGHFDLRYFF